MSRIIEIKESTFVKVSVGMMVAFAVFWLKAGRLVESVDNLKVSVQEMKASVNACLMQCPKASVAAVDEALASKSPGVYNGPVGQF